MRTTNLVTRALAMATFAAVLIACGSSGNPTNDAGSDASTQPDVVEASTVDAGKDALADVAADVTSDANNPLAISPLTPTAKGCSTDIVTFTASGGAPPYTWTSSDGTTVDLIVINATQATWEDNGDNFCGSSGTITVTVKDSASATATATITVTPG